MASLILAGGYFATTLINKKNEPIKIEKKEELKIKTVDVNKEHIVGSKDADLFVIEYTDLECPGCKRFNKIEKSLIKKYKDDPRVAFIIRHFPLYKSIGKTEPKHPSAGVEARATECVAKLAGEKQFFKMVDKIFETTKSDGHYPVQNLSNLAVDLGVSENDFNKCIGSEEIKNKIDKDWDEAKNSGVTATPAVYIQVKSANQSFKIVPGKIIIEKAIDAFLESN